VKSLVEILVKKCGLDAVKAVMPEEHMKLLTNIRKVSSDVSQICRVLKETGLLETSKRVVTFVSWSLIFHPLFTRLMSGKCGRENRLRMAKPCL
jgi:hypothetical protein